MKTIEKYCNYNKHRNLQGQQGKSDPSVPPALVHLCGKAVEVQGQRYLLLTFRPTGDDPHQAQPVRDHQTQTRQGQDQPASKKSCQRNH